MRIDVPDKYDPATREVFWKEFWEREGVFRFNDPKDRSKVFSIDTPPPTVSGRMHVGHSYSFTHADFIARYHRMAGKEVFFPFGTDDNGVATERLVEKLKNVRGSRMERSEFITLCRETIDALRPEFVDDWKRIGMSCDFSLFYSTIDDHSIATSQRLFLDLVEKGMVYRKEAPVMWDPQLQTALSQTELEDREQETLFNDILFARTDGSTVTIATTRPEMLCACVAVFVHPDDARFTNLVGEALKVPYYDYDVPVLADERVLMDKGTGVVMCCTFGDQTDIEWYRAYSLPLREAITRDGRMSELAGELAGLPIKEARKMMIDALKERGLLTSQKKITHTVNVGERSGVEIEIINSKQWFVRTLDIRDELLRMGEELAWHPPHMKNRYDNWTKGVQWDWCISRQRFFGVPFPVWYDQEDNPIFASRDALPVDPLSSQPEHAPDAVPESDVMDTWATSSLTPFITLGLLGDDALERYYPMDLRPQAHDIISFWLFNTIVRGIHHRGELPWEHAMVSGWVLDPHGRKMSKSKGNVIDPQEILKTYSADALRYAASIVRPGDDAPYQEKDVQQGFKTANKLFNIVKFTLPHLGSMREPVSSAKGFVDAWMLTKLSKMIFDYRLSFESYDYAAARRAVDGFLWDVLADQYVEFVKYRLYGEDESAKGPLFTAIHAIIRLYAPIMPYVTEEVYHYGAFGDAVSVHHEPFPIISFTSDHEVKGDLLVEVVRLIRKEKSLAQKSMKVPVSSLVITLPQDNQVLVDDAFLAEVREIMFVDRIDIRPGDLSVSCVF